MVITQITALQTQIKMIQMLKELVNFNSSLFLTRRLFIQHVHDHPEYRTFSSATYACPCRNLRRSVTYSRSRHPDLPKRRAARWRARLTLLVHRNKDLVKDGEDSSGSWIGMSIAPEVAVLELVGIARDDVHLVCHGRNQNLRNGVLTGRNALLKGMGIDVKSANSKFWHVRALAVVQTPGPEYRTLVEQCLCIHWFGFNVSGGCLCYSYTVRADDHLHVICWISAFFKGNTEVLSHSTVIGDASIC